MVDLLTREYEVNYSHIDNRGIAKPSFLWNIIDVYKRQRLLHAHRRKAVLLHGIGHAVTQITECVEQRTV